MRFIFLLLFLSTSLAADVTVDLREPSLESGVISTTKGGVITGPRFRLQAENISYIKRKDVHQVEASCFVMVDFGDYVLIGTKLFYDFESQTGYVENGVSRESPWFIAGERIDLCADGSYTITNATLTTSESRVPDWDIYAKEVHISRKRTVTVKNLKLQLVKLPFFWFPSFKISLTSLTEAPIKFYTRWGGKQGVRVGARYTLLDLEYFKTYLRLDWRIKRGLGGGVETYYLSEDGNHSLETINYYAHDNSLEDLDEKVRYRFQGLYKNSLYDDSVSVYASWDKLSDKDMATDYNDRGLELDTAGRTELLVRKQDEWWITNFSSRLRLNQFQTVKQELPSLRFSQRPYVLGDTGILVENDVEASYLDFKYSSDVRHVNDYSSPRLLHEFRVLRPFHPSYINITPEIGATTAVYGNSPADNAKLLLLGYGGVKVNTSLYHTLGNYKHTLYPYINWEYLSAPTVNPDDHYIFDIEDGLWKLNYFRIGARQDLLTKSSSGEIRRLVETDLYTYQFIDSAPIPKLFGNITWRTFSTVKHSITTGWDFNVNQLDHLNFRNDWTVTNDCAVSLEWRHRSRYCYRKAVFDNFILDSFRSTRALLNSSVSDRRDTLLCHLFWRIHPLFAIEFESRHGWLRTDEPSYNEFEVDFLARLPSHWNVKFSYAHTEADDRVALYFSLDLNRPKETPCLIRSIAF